MIGQTFPFGKGFKGLVRYLLYGDAGEERDRVAWIETRNLPTKDPEAAARLMSATARESVLTQRPLYHLVISADPGDPADRKSMMQVADATLRNLGLGEHQALIIAHSDTDHPHIHIVVNRVHPERYRAWEKGWDWPRIQRTLREQEAELGWKVVPGTLAPVLDADGKRLRPAPALARGSAEFLRYVREHATPVLEQARSWAEVEERLAAVGLNVRIKGGGLTFHDEREEVKASEVGPAFSRSNMEKRLGKLSAYRAETGRAARAAAELGAAAERQREPEPQPAREPEAAPPPAVTWEPVPPVAPARPLERPTRRIDPEAERMRLAVHRAAELVRAGLAAQEPARRIGSALKELDEATSERDALETSVRDADGAAKALPDRLRAVYGDLDAALRKFAPEKLAKLTPEQLAKVKQLVRDQPHRFGELRPDQPRAKLRRDMGKWGRRWDDLERSVGVGTTHHSARREAALLAVHVEHTALCERARPTPEAVEAARKRVREAEAATEAARTAKHGRGRSRLLKEYLQDAALIVHALPEEERAQFTSELAALLPPASKHLAAEVFALAHERARHPELEPKGVELF